MRVEHRLALTLTLMVFAGAAAAAPDPASPPLRRSLAALHDATGNSPDAADLWFDIGIAEATTGSLGQARFALERALWLSPFDREARAARDLVSGAARRAQAERSGERSIQQGEAASIAWWRGAASLPIGLIADSAALLSGLLFATYLGSRFARSGTARERSRWTLIGTAIALPLLVAVALAAAWGRDHLQTAVVLTANPVPRTGPDALASRAKNHGLYEAGLVALREEREGWCRVESASSADLWLRCSELGRINPPSP